MYKGKKPRWRTKEGQLLRLRDMSDAHLINARQAVLEGKVALRHTCWSAGGQDGPCPDCDAARSWRDNWLDRFDGELVKRHRGTVTQVAILATPAIPQYSDDEYDLLAPFPPM
jgi:hypothetical protein